MTMHSGQKMGVRGGLAASKESRHPYECPEASYISPGLEPLIGSSKKAFQLTQKSQTSYLKSNLPTFTPLLMI